MRAFVLCFLILAGTAPAIAGQRAVYAGSDGKQIVVEVADSGDARAGEAGSGDYVLVTGGRGYVVGAHGSAIQVVAIDDIMAAIDSVVAPIFGDALNRPLDGAQPLTAFRIVAPPGQNRSVGGRDGAVLQVYGDDPLHPDQPGDWVVSTDPTLKAIGAALQAYLVSALLPDAVFRGPAAGDRVVELRQLFAKGTPLVGGRRFSLQQIDTVAVASARVSLPAPALGRAQLLQAMRSAR